MERIDCLVLAQAEAGVCTRDPIEVMSDWLVDQVALACCQPVTIYEKSAVLTGNNHAHYTFSDM